MDQPSLYAHDRPITTPFGLVGTDENALTYALAFTFQEYPPLLQRFLYRIGITGVRRSSISKVRIDLQRHGRDESQKGITDIELHLPGHFHVIIEAKVGMTVPSIKQCTKYLARFHSTKERTQRLVALIQSSDTTFVDRYAQQDSQLNGRLVGFNWSELIPECARLMSKRKDDGHSLQWVQWFYLFLDQEYRMRTFSTEVWILPTRTKPLWPNGLSFLDIHQKYLIYFDNSQPNVRPLYIGLRADGKVKELYRVTGIDYGVPAINYVPELANLKKEWPTKPYTVWHLDDPVSLPKPIPSGNIWVRRTQCDFDLLLKCKSVLEIESMMRERRKAKEPVSVTPTSSSER